MAYVSTGDAGAAADAAGPAGARGGDVSPEIAAWLKRKRRDRVNSNLTNFGAWSISILTCGALVAAAIAVVASAVTTGTSARNAVPSKTAAVVVEQGSTTRAF